MICSTSREDSVVVPSSTDSRNTVFWSVNAIELPCNSEPRTTSIARSKLVAATHLQGFAWASSRKCQIRQRTSTLRLYQHRMVTRNSPQPSQSCEVTVVRITARTMHLHAAVEHPEPEFCTPAKGSAYMKIVFQHSCRRTMEVVVRGGEVVHIQVHLRSSLSPPPRSHGTQQ